ncbi:MAG: hypothetical protein QXV83_01795 [Candidatus Anstonellaceae archaeon]
MKNKILAFLIIFLQISFSFLYENLFEPEYLEVQIAPDYSWITISFLSLFIVGLVGVIGIMLGEIFGERIVAYSKNILYSVIKSAIIILIITTIFVFFSFTQYSQFYLYNLVNIDFSIEQAKMIRAQILEKFSFMTLNTIVFSLIGNISPYFRPAGIIGISFSIAPAFRPFFDIMGILLSSLTTASGIWYAQVWFLTFIKAKLFSLFLPIGIFLRATKLENIGNALIAISIGFFFIYPLILNIAFAIYWEYMKITSDINYKVVSSDGKEFEDVYKCLDYKMQQIKMKQYDISCKVVGESMFEFLYSILKTSLQYAGENILTSIITFGIMFFLSKGLIMSLVVVASIVFTIAFIKISIEYVIILSLIIPIIVVFLTFLAIDEIAKFLGTEIDISAFEKIF